MRKGLKSTLMTVAVALLGFKAMAMAPTIDAVPDVIIGDAENNGTNANLFVYPNAINGNTIVHDDATSAGAIVWSFATTSPSHYAINGVPSTFGQIVNPVTPGAYDITASDDPVTSGGDTNHRTFTLRNIRVSPLTGTGAPNGPYADPGYSGITTDSQVLTLFASDGTTVSNPGRSFRAFILNDGFDHLSGGGTQIYSKDWTTGTNGWVSITKIPGSAITFTQSATNGLCVDAAAAGVNYGSWDSEVDYGNPAPHNFTTVSYTDNAVYHVRTTVSTSAQGGHTPLWYVFFENTLDWYGGVYQVFDNGIAPTPGAETPSAGGTVFEEYLNPPQQAAAGFKAAIVDATNSQFKDFRLEVGVLDIAGNPVGSTDNGYDAINDSGAVCWKSLALDKFDMSTMVVTSTPYTVVPSTSNQTVSQPLPGTSGNVTNDATAPAGLKIVPPSQTAWQPTPTGTPELFEIFPGSGASAPDASNNYPVPWTAGQLYRVVYSMMAPDAISESNPPSFFYFGGYAATIELIDYAYVTNQITLTGAAGPSAMPRQAAPIDYYMFWHGNYGTSAAAPAAFKSMRPFLLGGSTQASFLGTLTKGGVKITNIRVELVHF